MQVPLQIKFEGTEPSDAARFQIEQEVDRLESHNNRIISCLVTVSAPSRKHRHGSGFEIGIVITIPQQRAIVVSHPAGDDIRYESASDTIKVAFASARRQIDEFKQRA